MRTIAVINQKGGVGKTTTTMNLAHALMLQDFRVTVIDLDPQGQLSTSFGLHRQDMAGLDSVLLEKTPVIDVVQPVRDGIQLIPAGTRLNEVEHLSEGGSDRGLRLKNALHGAFSDQDYILIDCPPSSGLLTVNALFASREVLVPVGGDYLALDGVSQMVRTLKSFESMTAYTVSKWFAVTRFHPRGRLARDVVSRLQEYFPSNVLGTPVRETVALAESPSFGQTIFEYSPKSHGAEDYRYLARDLVQGRTL